MKSTKYFIILLFLILFFFGAVKGVEAAPQKKTYEGEIQAIVSDNFEKSISHTEYSLKTTSGEIIPLEFNEDPKLKSKTKIRLSATKIDKKAFVQNTPQDLLKDIQILESSLPSLAFGEKKVLAIMVNFDNDSSIQPINEEDVRNVVFTGDKSVNSYFQEVSYGKLSLKGNIRQDGDIFGWYTIPFDNSVCDYHNWKYAANTAVTLANPGIDLTIYDHILYIFAAGSCSSSAMGGVNTPNSYYFLLAYASRGFTPFVVAHELGHNYGLLHANSYICKVGNSCADQQIYIGNDCVENEYGDHFDLMGKGRSLAPEDLPLHTNAFFKMILGWLEPIRVKTVTSDGIFTIYPSEINSSGFQLLVIPIQFRGETEYYFLEYRQSIGFDEHNIANGYWMKQGIIVRISSKDSRYGPTAPSSLLIDSTPDDNCNPTDGILQVGDTFVDQTRGITIKLLSKTDNYAMVEVKFIDLNQNLVLTNIPIANDRTGYYRSCDTRCSDFNASCGSVGTDLNASNYRNYTLLCVEQSSDCSKVMEKTHYTCEYNNTDWTNCNCLLPTTQLTPTSTPSPTPALVSGDGNNDGQVDGQDFIIWLIHYGQNVSGATNGDYNDSGEVETGDYLIWLNNYGS